MKYCVFVSIMVAAFNSYAQASWEKSWCVTQDGDTLRGEILFEDWTISPSQITFRGSPDAKQTIFATNNLKGFTIQRNRTNETFESKRVRITIFSDLPVGFNSSPVSRDTISRFIELKFRSEVASLYFLSDDQTIKHYYLLKDSIMTELEHGSVILIRDGKALKYDNNEYKSQLQSLLKECPTLNVSGLSYTDRSLIKLLEEYHAYCKIDYPATFKNQSQTKISLGFAGGYFLTPPDVAPMYGLDLTSRFLLPKRFNNRFVMVKAGLLVSDDIWWVSKSGHEINHYMLNFSLNAGSYFGKEKNIFFPFIYGGLSSRMGLNAGAGISFKKQVDLSAQVKIGANAFLGFEAKVYPFPISPRRTSP